jgi:hypothetical protein
LEQVSANIADIYATKSGLPLGEVRTLMKSTTWLTAEGAVASGFADSVAESNTATADEPAPTSRVDPSEIRDADTDTHNPLAAFTQRRHRMNARRA